MHLLFQLVAKVTFFHLNLTLYTKITKTIDIYKKTETIKNEMHMCAKCP